VDRIAEQVLSAAPACPGAALLTDAGSTKAKIVAAIEDKLGDGATFVGSHPLSGSEKRGPEHAEADLFVNRWTVVTPTPRTDPKAVERTKAFWEALGARVRLMSPEEHDRALAVTSHLPHVAACALAGILAPELHELTAGGFRDSTRVAAGDPALWSAIFAHNRQAILDALAHFSDRLQEFRLALQNGDARAIDDLLTRAKKARDALGS
jgi:prephenate dehydrogenase